MQTCRQFLNSTKSQTCEFVGFSTAFLADIISFILSETYISFNRLFIAEIFLSCLPSCIFITSAIIFSCYPGENKRDDPIGHSALSFTQTSFYLLARTALDLVLIFVVQDYLKRENSYEKIVNGCESIVEGLYMFSFFCNKPLEKLFAQCCDQPRDEEESNNLLSTQ